MGIKLGLREKEVWEAVKDLLEAGILREAGEGELVLDEKVYHEIVTAVEGFVGQKVHLGDIVYITYISILEVIIARVRPADDRRTMTMTLVLLHFFKGPLERIVRARESRLEGGYGQTP